MPRWLAAALTGRRCRVRYNVESRRSQESLDYLKLSYGNYFIIYGKLDMIGA